MTCIARTVLSGISQNVSDRSGKSVTSNYQIATFQEQLNIRIRYLRTDINPNKSRNLAGEVISNLPQNFWTPGKVRDKAPMDILDQYVMKSPSAQNAINIFGGEWSSKIPGGFQSGQSPLFEDGRVGLIEANIEGGFVG